MKKLLAGFVACALCAACDNGGYGVAAMSDCDGGKLDPSTDLCWQDPPTQAPLAWNEAIAYCDALSLEGRDDWRLPMIQELISLVRGCVDGVTTDERDKSLCGLTDPDCLSETCADYSPSSCGGCAGMGLSDDGPLDCYWDPVLQGSCAVYWSSSPYDGLNAWFVDFDYGGASVSGKDMAIGARCVRSGP